MEQEEENYLKELERQKDEAVTQRNQMVGAQNSMFGGGNDPNLIEFQLELDNILDRVEHLLKGDILEEVDGNLIYVKSPDKNNRPLNHYGVQFLMNVLSFYLNRNTILSNYSSERIDEILYDIGYELTDQIYLNAEKMGLDTEEKRKRYSIIVLQIVHTIESAYKRAYMGEERRTLRETTIVTQSANQQNPMQPGNISRASNEFKLMSPSTWLRR